MKMCPLLLFMFISFCSTSQIQLAIIDSLENVVHRNNVSLIEKGEALIELDLLYWAISPRKCGKNIEIFKVIVDKTKNKKLELALDVMQMRATFNTAKYDESYKIANNGLAKAQSLNDQSNIIRILVHLTMLNNADRSGNDVGGLSRAKESINKAKNLLTSNVDPLVYSAYHQTLAGVYISERAYDQAIKVLNDNLKFIDESMFGIHLSIHQAYTYNLLGRSYLSIQNFDKAKHYLNKAEKIVEAYEMRGIKYIVYLHKAILNEKTKDNKQAEIYYNKCITEIPFMSENKVPVILKSVASFYSRLNEWEKAFQYLLEQTQYKDSLIKEESRAAFLRFEQEFESKEKESKIAKLENEKRLAEYKKYRFQIIFFLSIFIFIVILVMGLLFWRTKLKLISEVKLKEMVMSLVAHDIRSPLLGLQAALPLIVDSLHSGKPQTQIKLIQKLQFVVSDLSILIDNVFRWVRINRGNKILKISSFDLYNELEQVVNDIKFKADERNIVINIHCGYHKNVNTDRLILLAIFRNLLDNAIKFSYDNGIIEVAIHEKNSEIHIDVKDNGIGIDGKIADDLFLGKQNHVRAGITGVTGSGLGLFISKQLAQHCNLGLEYLGSEKGAAFQIVIPDTSPLDAKS